MSDLVNGAEVPWDFVSGPREQSRHLPAVRPPETLEQCAAAVAADGGSLRLRDMTWTGLLRRAAAGRAAAQRAVLHALLSGDGVDREQLRGRVTVGQVMALSASLERGERR